MRVKSLLQNHISAKMDSPENDTDRNGTADGNFSNSHYPLLSVENGLPTDGVDGKRGLFKVNGKGSTQEDEGMIICYFSHYGFHYFFNFTLFKRTLYTI